MHQRAVGPRCTPLHPLSTWRIISSAGCSALIWPFYVLLRPVYFCWYEVPNNSDIFLFLLFPVSEGSWFLKCAGVKICRAKTEGVSKTAHHASGPKPTDSDKLCGVSQKYPNVIVIWKKKKPSLCIRPLSCAYSFPQCTAPYRSTAELARLALNLQCRVMKRWCVCYVEVVTQMLQTARVSRNHSSSFTVDAKYPIFDIFSASRC